ncbi:DUF1697 domain-containing protein [Primorskyibacter aestuariivivens]|uniref:DUF1697 domain-containing protein n=1 Tax=Primorskyibacter aestuariivivens TaxID=1888912 RepID=UPI00230115BF|nr:DUF1697 domain-containing protein [Primorskyibacter aestuariivivens]MDA7430222.1 DUF1697 domain-containing protein [Primorskyibacter aestuariivivens]
MSTEIILLRGINVGGRHRLPMQDLRHMAIACGAATAQSYLQSGNLVVHGHVDIAALASGIEASHGFSPAILSRSLDQWRDVVSANPFPEVEDHRALNVFFLSGASELRQDDLVQHAGPGERLHVASSHVYLHCPALMSGSKIAPKLERLTVGEATARNWRTVAALLDMAEAMDAAETGES